MKLGSKSERLVTLSPFGRYTVAGAHREMMVQPATVFDWANAVVDAAIIAALIFFTTLSGVGVLGTEITNTLVSATISAAAQFFLMLAIKRGLRQK